MLTVTPSAYTRLTKILSGQPANVAVRIVRRAGRSKLRRSIPRPGDEVFMHEGRPVLVLDEDAARHFEKGTLGIRQTDGVSKLRCRHLRSHDAA